jgi:hypothetical protein
MGIRVGTDRLMEVLERAVVIAESDVVLPRIWFDRVERIAECPSRTYIAALGTALLAKATEPRIDTLAVKSKAGPTAYSMRGVVRVLVEKAPIYGYHLGRTGPEPLNNQPWFGSDRVDRFENVRGDALPFHRDMVRYLTELNGASADEALQALAAFLRLRIEFGEQEREAARSLVVEAPDDVSELIQMVSIFLRDDPEGGRRGQALVAALLDMGHEEVYLAPINDPTGLDVSIGEEGRLLLGVEVKQKPVVEATALHLAEEAAQRDIDKTLLVAIAPDQRALDRERIRREALREHGVVVSVYESVSELVSEIALHAPVSAAEFARDLPAAYLRRMQEHEVSHAGQQYWADLCRGFSADQQHP